MSDPIDRADEDILDSPIPEDPESVDPGEAEDIDDDATVTDEEDVDPVFDDDVEVLNDNLGYEE
ncbi:hypothetical protein N1028_14075 [Herbiconiux sp. CPCC 203407]|uniref:Uncharacterized protein n=1 Tax=Herbiconiux oxytropis TaxID=2970915 RepID=A0AA41XJ66_9MICO|nr:hypothetical protein [Herbiconiux oxytropis]MCS5722753.1 hypothetical protein [Herbiconiux oxytropis]MCS5727023.1 hypothetical protein [Herbiconiux oxytropis]